MMKKIFLCVLLFLIFVNEIFAQNNAYLKTSFSFEIVHKNAIIFKAVVNEKDTLNFFFDTGATSSLIDSSVAEKIGIKPNYEQSVEGAGGKKIYQVALNQRVKINQIQLDSVHFVFEDLTRLRESMNYPFDGIIGYSIIEKYITEVDFDNQVIYLYSKDYKFENKEYTSFSFTFDKGIPIPQFDISIELENQKKYTGKIFFDSGAGLTLLVNSPFNEEYHLNEQAPKTLTSVSNNLSVRSVSQSMAIKSLSLGKFDFSDLPIGLAYDKVGVSSYKGYLGILGADVINRFNFILDYKAMKLYLKPNKNYDQSFRFPLTGITLSKNDNEQIYISEIAEESPAYQKGMRKGAVILSIESGCRKNRKVFKTLQECKEILQKEGEKVKIRVEDNGKIKTYQLKLKRLL